MATWPYFSHAQGPTYRLFKAPRIISPRMDKACNDELQKAIEQVVRSEFSDAAIEAVHIAPGHDEDGDVIVWVTVVFKSDAAFDAKKAKGLTRHLFPALRGSCRDAFPVVSFRSKTDHARVSAAA